jgi:DNA primase
VRTAIALLLQQPGLVQHMTPPYRFAELRQPGIALLMELIALVRARPDITTGGLLEHFAEREEGASLHKLALMEFPAAVEQWRAEFLDALAQLDRQTLQQRIDELLARQEQGALTDAEKVELRESLSAKAKR